MTQSEKNQKEPDPVLPEEKTATISFISFDQGGWCECSHCGAMVHGYEDRCGNCGYKFVPNMGPSVDLGGWGGSDF
jgi:hypothetical protein